MSNKQGRMREKFEGYEREQLDKMWYSAKKCPV